MAPKKLIRISDDGMVHLCISPVRWSMLLPKVMKKKLLDGAKNVAQVRSQISLAAKLRWMPPVEIVDEIWMCGEGTIHGRATPIKVGNSTYMGVQLPAQTAVHDNNEELRKILVHEFAHCFYFAEQGISAVESGRDTIISAVEDIYENEEADRERLPKLSDWSRTPISRSTN